MKIGDYVRIRKHRDNTNPIGITRIEVLKECPNDLFIEINYKIYRKCQVIKSSPNIIDLVEVGDYVNGHLVFDIAQAPKKAVYIEDNKNEMAHRPYTNEDIKSIITHEQFEQMEYKIKE